MKRNLYIMKRLSFSTLVSLWNRAKSTSFSTLQSLKYGCNPNQKAAIANNPFQIINGHPSYINMLDALTSWQLVHELSQLTGKVVATSFKHVTPTGVALAEDSHKSYQLARNIDSKSSFGDFISISHPVNKETAQFIQKVVSDGIVAPSFTPEALELLRTKKKGKFLILQSNPEQYSSQSTVMERRELFGATLFQERNQFSLAPSFFQEMEDLSQDIQMNLIIASMILKYTPSNSISISYNQQVIGVGAGQQNRVDCLQIAGKKAMKWLQKHKIDNPQNLVMASDGFIPFPDTVELASEYGIQYIIQPGGSINDSVVQQTCQDKGIHMITTGNRLFYH